MKWKKYLKGKEKAGEKYRPAEARKFINILYSHGFHESNENR